MSEKISSIISVRARDSVSVINSNTKKGKRTLKEVQAIASKLEDSLGKQTPSRFPLYCKYAWHLPENIIWTNLETALAATKGDSRKLFSWLCEQHLND